MVEIKITGDSFADCWKQIGEIYQQPKQNERISIEVPENTSTPQTPSTQTTNRRGRKKKQEVLENEKNPEEKSIPANIEALAEGGAVTLEDVKTLLTKVTQVPEGIDRAINILRKYNAGNIKELKQQDYGSCVKELNAVLLAG